VGSQLPPERSGGTESRPSGGARAGQAEVREQAKRRCESRPREGRLAARGKKKGTWKRIPEIRCLSARAVCALPSEAQSAGGGSSAKGGSSAGVVVGNGLLHGGRRRCLSCAVCQVNMKAVEGAEAAGRVACNLSRP